MKKYWILGVAIATALMLSGQTVYASEVEVENESSEEVSSEELVTEDEEQAVVSNYGYIDSGIRVDTYEALDNGMNTIVYNSTIPSSYDSREYGRVTSVKNQNPYGTCWAFAAMGAAESSLLSQGIVNSADEIDLSEYQFAYFFYHYALDPLGYLKNDYTTVTNNSYLQVGGNNYYSMFALATWRGCADESLAPYENVTNTSALDSSLAFNDVAHMQNTYIISMQDMDDVKRQIMENGSVASSIYMDEINYYNAATEGYYQNVSNIANHAILVVGWDDTYSASNFKASCRPNSDGAWLIKNSWGNYIDYFWISYEDLCLSNQDAFSYYFEEADNYDFNYQYDGSYGTSYGIISDGASIANVFECNGSEYEQIEAVSIALWDDNIKYSVQIYLNPPTGNPKEGTPMLETPVTGTTTYTGYYTIELDEPVLIENGDTFAVVFTLNNVESPDSGVTYFADGTITGGCIEFISYTEENKMYLYNYPYYPEFCIDLYDSASGWCPRIKAFTSSVEDDTVRSITDCSITVSDQEYTGSKLLPIPHVSYNGKNLVNNVDYTLSYTNNIRMGTATVTVTGKGKYTGSQSANFRILGKLNPTTVYNGIDYSAVYDYNYYVEKYNDIWNAYGKNDSATIAHFVNHGMNEGRQGNVEFNVTSYAYKYYDLRRVFKNDLRQYYFHYIYSGKREGRIATGTTTMQGGLTTYNGVDYSAVYQVGYYANKYKDLRNTCGLDDEAYLIHFVNDGMREGRQAISSFNVMSYAYKYYDLRRVFKNDLRQYYLHYIYSGKREGRVATGTTTMQGGLTIYNGVDYSAVYNVGYYAKKYSDLRNVCGLDDEAYLVHFVSSGMNEGRQASATFNVVKYRNRYADLRNVFGTNLRMYYLHYISNGKSEGRKAV
ncbi:MAG: hypothetical protein IJ040_07070 [Lachnospiraceae bacterium]|nr:hypothetical protein [Lachnospiraceae bacterium]